RAIASKFDGVGVFLTKIDSIAGKSPHPALSRRERESRPDEKCHLRGEGKVTGTGRTAIGRLLYRKNKL
ncbi:MAG: hypothetical protein ACK2U1_09185, partial [Anaerolineales bacterium]